ncbi:MAG: hypothetical protein ACE144_12710 [Thermodesulfobacteriota bacterium]
MNNKQRIVLIIGAAAFLYFILTSPKISIVKGTYVKPPLDRKDIAKMADVRTAMTRAVAVFGATLLVSIALRDKKGARTQSGKDGGPVLDEECQDGGGQPVKRDVIARILRFLREFF